MQKPKLNASLEKIWMVSIHSTSKADQSWYLLKYTRVRQMAFFIVGTRRRSVGDTCPAVPKMPWARLTSRWKKSPQAQGDKPSLSRASEMATWGSRNAYLNRETRMLSLLVRASELIFFSPSKIVNDLWTQIGHFEFRLWVFALRVWIVLARRNMHLRNSIFHVKWVLPKL